MTVPLGVFQVESGLSRESDQAPDGAHKRTTRIDALLRYGLTSTVEARLNPSGYIWQNAGGERQEGAEDLAFGFKWHHRPQRKFLPSVGSILSTEVASGARSVAGHGWQPTYELPMDWDLPADCALTVMPGLAYFSQDQKRFVAPFLGVVGNRSWTPRLNTFVEWAAQQWASAADGGNKQSVDTGLQWIVTPDIQLDGSIWWGLTRASAPVFWTVGFSFRLAGYAN